MKTRRREGVTLTLSILVLLFCFSFLTRLLTPKQHDMGSTWGHYLEEDPNSLDILYFGSSLVYCDVVPAVVWEETGLSSYVLAGPEQPMPMTYYYFSEALKTQHPQAVFVEVTGMFYNRYTNYTKTNVGQMPWGINRLKATMQESESEVRSGLLFPLLFYHDRWSSLTADDWKTALTGYKADPLAGYTYLDSYKPMDGVYQRDMAPDAANVERNYEFLQKIYARCLAEDIQPVFYIAPGMGRVPSELVTPLEDAIAADMPEAVFLNCNSHTDAIGADPARDYYDTLHYNVAGAEKFSRFLGHWINDTLALTPKQPDATLWQSRADHFAELLKQPVTPQAS